MQRKDQMNIRDSRASADEMAAYWLVALKNPDVAPAVFRRWEKWIAVPANRQAFDEAQQVWELMDEIPPPSWPSDAQVKADTYDGSTTIAAFDEQENAKRRRRSQLKSAWFGLAAAVGVAAIGLGLVRMMSDSNEPPAERMTVFETEPAQHEKVALVDGSEIHLGARSSVTTNLTRGVRFVVMDRGEALFKVAHDPKRPFRVLAGAGVITAVGTAFNVRRLDDLVVVTVSEGTVEVAPASAVNARNGGDYPRGKRVTRGESITYDSEGNLSAVRKVDLGMTMSWRSGQLQYRSEPLNRVVQDINRYSRKSITIADTAAGEVLYSGTVFERDIEDWLAALDKAFPELVVSHPDPQHVVIRSRLANVL